MAARGARGAREVPAHIMGPRIILLLTTLALLLLGFVMVYSTSSVIALSTGDPAEVNPMADMVGQVKYAAVGIVLAIILWKFIPYTLWKSNAVWIVWGVAFVLLLATAFMGVGEDEWGASRWLAVGGASLQPSEFAKIALVLVAARLFSDFRDGQLTVSTFFVLIFLLVLAPVLLVLVQQSDLGTAMICVVGIVAVMWLGEVPTRVIVVVLLAVVALGLVGIFGSEYRRARLMVFLNPWNDGEGGYGTGYQLIHSLYAISGGGLFGVGLGNSHEKFLYLTQSDTDFIFAIIAEELGLVGALAVIVLFLLFLYAGMRVARSAPDGFGTMIAGGLTIMIAFQAFLNIAMVIGWFPVVGKPLPFISSGGSSLIASLMMVGLILSVSQGSNVSEVYERRRADLRVVRAEPAEPRSGSSRARSNRR
ncbi:MULTISPECIES: FtsW/RodA/SpoVE family cell cycle protein [Gordonibacter]|uniref:Probable peptidoglycan glycosyltransferase FtsW n=2 Tax=Gordonibacter TaxID=644652 RepID=A0ABT7DMV4_9ACTN|nr:putative peptidoglycan glycosyltransferase FtsW [Gordonibacter sp. KGMB12511]MDJ1650862.1 putative peptidoglycan glycosyltransferase FtsW [Gordonibacter sp. KGMB12511]HIW76118.1 putative lipid II flippase FtsW [Candidatus Gordonibacter avicola]